LDDRFAVWNAGAGWFLPVAVVRDGSVFGRFLEVTYLGKRLLKKSLTRWVNDGSERGVSRVLGALAEGSTPAIVEFVTRSGLEAAAAVPRAVPSSVWLIACWRV